MRTQLLIQMLVMTKRRSFQASGARYKNILNY